MIGAAWPCPESQRVSELLDAVGRLLTAKGLGTGRHTYGWYSDADFELCSAIWCVTRHIAPATVIETGVAHGISSRVILEALAENGRGHLSSIDLPHPLNSQLHGHTGVAVPESLRPRWTYLEGESRKLLPSLVAQSEAADLFIHDSLHTAENTLFEMEQVASAMRPGGVMLIDDIRGHDGFKSFARRHPEYKTMLCSTADQLAGFGVAVCGAPTLPSAVTP